MKFSLSESVIGKFRKALVELSRRALENYGTEFYNIFVSREWRLMAKRKFKRSGEFYVYILECADKTYYTGHTNNLERRLGQHNTGKGGWYTRVKGSDRIVWKKEFRYFKVAFKTEKKIKHLTRIQKESIVKGEPLGRVFAEARK